MRSVPTVEARASGGRSTAAHRASRPTRCCSEEQPPVGEHEERQRRGEALAEIRQQVPAIEQGQGVGDEAALAGGHPGKKPWQELPVAANPAVPDAREAREAHRAALEHPDVVGEGDAREHALELVVAEDGVLGDAALEAARERGHVVEALAVELPGPEEGLVQGSGAGNDARLALAGDGQGPAARGQPQRPGGPVLDVRLEERVAGDHLPAGRIEPGLVQGWWSVATIRAALPGSMCVSASSVMM